MDSILETAKRACFLTDDVTAFDDQIILYVNSTLNTLTELGVGPEKGFTIEGKDDEWGDFLKGPKAKRLDMVKDYVGTKVRLAFDPPSSQTLVTILEKHAAELEWRILHEAEN